MKIGILIFMTVLNSSLGFSKIISGRLFDVSDEQPAIALFVFLNNEMKTNTDINGYFEFVSEEFNELNDIHIVNLGYVNLSIANLTPDSFGNIELDSIYIFPKPVIAIGCYFGKNPIIKLKIKLKTKKGEKIITRFENGTLPQMLKKKKLRYLDNVYQYQLRKDPYYNEMALFVDLIK